MHYACRSVTGKTTQLISLDAQHPAEVTRKPLFGMDRKALAALMVVQGEPAWRGRQLADAIYAQRVTGVEEVTTFPLALRERMTRVGWEVGRVPVVQVFRSVDGTERYLVQGVSPEVGGVPDTVETVWMPEGDEGESGDGSEEEGNSPGAAKDWTRATICVSSQVGCAVNCQFCLTAKLGLQRNLTAGEIAGQAVAVLSRPGVAVGRYRLNLVVTGTAASLRNCGSFLGARCGVRAVARARAERWTGSRRLAPPRWRPLC